MRLSALEHLVEATRSLTGCDTVTVLGSAALLVPFPALGGGEGPLAMTRDADLLIAPCDAAVADMVHEAIGAGSLFEARFGYHVDLLRPEITQVLPADWPERMLRLPHHDAFAVDPVDICCLKLLAARSKDLEVVQAVLLTTSVSLEAVRDRLAQCRLAERDLWSALRSLGSMRD